MPARPLRRFEPALLAVGLALAVHTGCSNDSAATLGVTHPTLIEIAPEQFRGQVPCAADGDEPGLKRYVATLFDPNPIARGSGGASGDERSAEDAGGAANDDDATDDFALPSSGPTSCLAGVGFGFIVPGRHYYAKIAGYARDDIAPRAPGSALVVDPDGAPVEPLWTAECDATLAVDQTIVRVKRCSSFRAADASAPGSVRVLVPALLGGLSCGAGPGEVERLAVSLEVDGDPFLQTVACDAGQVTFDDLPPHRQARAVVEAFSAGSVEPLAASSCAARTLPEAVVVAQCTALREEGALRVDLPAVLELLDLKCQDVTDVRLQAAGEEAAQSFPPPACGQSVEHELPAGAANLTVSVVHDGEVSAVSCFGQVSPGRTVLAECELP